MFNDELKSSLLKQIELSGSVSEDSAIIKPHINRELSNVLDESSGKIRIKPSLTNSSRGFNLILSSPASLSAINPLQIRCLNCKKVISYPAWHYVKEFARNHFHYFICFNGNERVKLNCQTRLP